MWNEHSASVRQWVKRHPFWAGLLAWGGIGEFLRWFVGGFIEDTFFDWLRSVLAPADVNTISNVLGLALPYLAAAGILWFVYWLGKAQREVGGSIPQTPLAAATEMSIGEAYAYLATESYLSRDPLNYGQVWPAELLDQALRSGVVSASGIRCLNDLAELDSVFAAPGPPKLILDNNRSGIVRSEWLHMTIPGTPDLLQEKANNQFPHATRRRGDRWVTCYAYVRVNSRQVEACWPRPERLASQPARGLTPTIVSAAPSVAGDAKPPAATSADVADALRYVGLVVYRDVVPGTQPASLDKIQLGFELENAADVTLSYTVEEIASSAAERTHPPQSSWGKDALIGPKSRTRCMDYPISLGGLPCPERMSGTLTMVLRYGRLGAETLVLPLKAVLEIYFDPATGNYLSARQHWDVEFAKHKLLSAKT